MGSLDALYTVFSTATQGVIDAFLGAAQGMLDIVTGSLG